MRSACWCTGAPAWAGSGIARNIAAISQHAVSPQLSLRLQLKQLAINGLVAMLLTRLSKPLPRL